MLDKIRLHAAGQLPAAYVANLGEAKPIFFDARTCVLLDLSYDELRARVVAGGTDEEILAWVEARGRALSDAECIVWNRFMVKLGWRDDRSALLKVRVEEFGLTGKPIETIFDLIEFDEGRDPVATKAWETV